MTHTLLDTGALIAFLDANDRAHQWAGRQWQVLRPPLLTCEPVLTETAHILQSRGLSVESLWELVRRSIVAVDFELSREIEPIAALMRHYADQPMDLADACLVRMTEKRKDVRVFTLDRDFKIYRRNGRQVIPLLFPD